MHSLKKILFLFSLACFPFFYGSLHAADGLIEAVSFHGKNAESESVSFRLNGFQQPKTFTLGGENTRVVFDFIGTRLDRSVSPTINANGNMISRIRFGRHENKTRAVIDLTGGGDVDFEQQFDKEKNVLTIRFFSKNVAEEKEDKPVPEAVEEEKPKTVSESAPADVGPAAEPEKAVVVEEAVVAEEAAAVVPEKEKSTEQEDEEAVTASDTMTGEKDDSVSSSQLIDVSFENTANKGEMVLFKLNGFYPPTVSGEEEENPKVICEFAGATLGEKVLRELATDGDFIKRVRVNRVDDADLVRVTLDLVANKNYDLQQVFFKEDNLFVIIVNSYDSLAAPEKKQ